MSTPALPTPPIQEEFCNAFETAEKYLKEAESFVRDVEILLEDDFQGLLFPAVNELRYAGFHATRALSLSGDPQKRAYELALHHCHSAGYDAVDVQIQFCLSECRRFQTDYRLVSIGEVVEDYQSDCALLRRVSQGVPRSDDMKQDLANLVPVVQDVKRIHEKWTVGREELNKILDDKRETRWHQFITGYGTMVSTVAAVIATICTVVLLFLR
jgi:hypothetical protein